MSNLEKYNNIFEDCLEISLKDLDYKLEYKSISEWDSIGHMTLITEIEDIFDIIFNTEDIIEFTSYDNGKEILSRYDIEMK